MTQADVPHRASRRRQRLLAIRFIEGTSYERRDRKCVTNFLSSNPTATNFRISNRILDPTFVWLVREREKVRIWHVNDDEEGGQSQSALPR
jgi:hypothetical protein